MRVRMRGFSRYTRLEDAFRIVLSHVERLAAEELTFERALGRVLAEDILAKTDVPPFDRSAVDGYAVRAADTFRATATKPRKLQVIGSADVGSPTRLRVHRGEALKIMTGAPMPLGADAVVMVENTSAKGRYLEVYAPITPGKNVSTRGEDTRAGEVVLRRGLQLRPQDIGMLASTGSLRVRVTRRPRVAILATGDELLKPGERLTQAKIIDINSYSLAAAVTSCGGLPHRLGIIPDDRRLLRRELGRAKKYDMVLISGGSSVGERDLVPDAIAELGEVLFHGVAIRPGGPTAFGTIGDKPVFALAGFPVASLVAFDLLARPALRKMQGLPGDRGYPWVSAKLSRRVSSTLGRADVVRVTLSSERGEVLADPIRITGSGILSSMIGADGFFILPEDIEGLDKGATVKVEVYRP